uniref:Nudix hydrolase 7 n=1 Tax=Piliocolobus tephrosceles TaxID=591936 RepID=A0A8C9HTW7_9PRIM
MSPPGLPQEPVRQMHW